MGMGSSSSQLDRVYGHLTRAPITPIEALKKYGCFRLAARIKDLRNLGHTIKTERIEKGGKSFASYRLA